MILLIPVKSSITTISTSKLLLYESKEIGKGLLQETAINLIKYLLDFGIHIMNETAKWYDKVEGNKFDNTVHKEWQMVFLLSNLVIISLK